MRRPDDPNSRDLDEARGHLIEMLVRVGEEDRLAFRELYRLTAAKLFGICLRICGERQSAEDVLHEVYLTVWKRAGAYQPDRASPITWMATIARNRAIDWRRRQHPERAVPIEAALPLPDPAPLAVVKIEAEQRTHGLNECLEELDPDQSEAIRSAFYDGRTYAEVAGATGVPLGTTKSRVRRGLLKLKKCLERD